MFWASTDADVSWLSRIGLSITQQGIRVKDLESNDGQISMDYSKYQFVEVGDFAMNHMGLADRIRGHLESKRRYPQALNSPAVRNGIKQILLDHAHLWESLGEQTGQ